MSSKNRSRRRVCSSAFTRGRRVYDVGCRRNPCGSRLVQGTFPHTRVAARSSPDQRTTGRWGDAQADDQAAWARTFPTGTVTFLFTDVEGSTKLLHSLGAEAYADALGEHRRVIREACAAEGGVEVDTQGDAFFFAFPTAPGALAAGAALTESLAPGAVHVRVGLHTGTPLVTDEGYVGDDVHRAARIAAVGHGGQVLVAASTAALVRSDALVDLGEHRFKDLAAPERVYQLGEQASLRRSRACTGRTSRWLRIPWLAGEGLADSCKPFSTERAQ